VYGILLINYYFVIAMDYHSNRYIFACTFMLYPWIARGLEYILYVDGHILNRISITSMLLLMFWLLPPAQCLKSLWGQDTVVKVAG
jgi:hypothetical protein